MLYSDQQVSTGNDLWMESDEGYSLGCFSNSSTVGVYHHSILFAVI